MTDQSEGRGNSTNKVPPWAILGIGMFLFLVAVVLYLDRAFGQQLSAFLMCIGLGLVFAAVGDQGEVQIKSGDGGLSWMSGLSIPFARFVGGAAVSFLLLGLLAFLAPWISLDSDRFARVLVRANTSLEGYRVSVGTNSAPLLGVTLLSGTDYEFVLFSSDVTPFVADVTLRADKIGDPSHTYLNSVEIPGIPIKILRDRIGNAEALVAKLDLKNGTLKAGDACYPMSGSESANPCNNPNTAELIERGRQIKSKFAFLDSLFWFFFVPFA